MQDIVLKKVSRQTPQEPEASQGKLESSPQNESLRAYVEEALGVANTLGGWFRKQLGPNEPSVITETSFIAASIPITPKKVSTVRRITPNKQRITQSVKSTAHRTKHAVRTPLGKVTLIQTTAMLILFGYAIHTAYKQPSQNPLRSTVGDQVSNSTTVLHQFLPTSPDQLAAQAASSQPVQLPAHLYSWISPWNITNQETVIDNYQSISAFWLTLQANGYDVSPKASWQDWQTFLSHHKKDGRQYYLTVTGDPIIVADALTNPEVQNKQIATLLETVDQQGFNGIDLDYEGIGLENRNSYTEFVRNISSAFHAHNKLVSVTVEARIANQVPMDWHALGGIADEVRIMAYDYHSKETNFPGPITPIGWLKEIMDYAQANIDPAKLVIALGNYGYDWIRSDDGTSWQGTGISFDRANAIAKEKNIPVVHLTGIDDRGYDIDSTPTFTYKDDANKEHSVWFEDSASLQSKLNLVSQYKNKGVIFWSVGLGDPAFWQANNHS
jgi:spore germination protein